MLTLLLLWLMNEIDVKACSTQAEVSRRLALLPQLPALHDITFLPKVEVTTKELAAWKKIRQHIEDAAPLNLYQSGEVQRLRDHAARQYGLWDRIDDVHRARTAFEKRECLLKFYRFAGLE